MRDAFALPALLDVPADAYHGDTLTDTPTLSKSIIHELLTKSPAHARIAHPKLNPAFERVDEQKFDVGTVAHQLFLEGIDRISIIPFDDWRSKAAKELRDESRAMGLTPLLAHQAEEVQAMVAAVRAQCDAFPVSPALFADGAAERTIVWSEGDVVCRARLDWLRDDLSTIDDLKTAARTAKAADWSRRLFWDIGCDIQAAFYTRGARAVLGTEPRFRFVVIETAPPYGLSVVEPDEETIAVGNAKVDRALEMWADCLATGLWPAYDNEIFTVAPPLWQRRWIEDALEEEAWAQM